MQHCHKYPPTPLSGLKVRYSAHGPFFARLRYETLIFYMECVSLNFTCHTLAFQDSLWAYTRLSTVMCTVTQIYRARGKCSLVSVT